LRSSGDHTITTRIAKRRNKYLRHLLIEASWVAVRKDPALLESFDRLIKRMKKQDAIIRIAKKLLNRIRYVWENNKPYVLGVIE
jgi:transposase